MIHNNSNLIGAAPGKNAKLFRTMLDPVVRYVFARSDNPGPLRSFINSVFADSHEPPIKELKILHPFDPQTYQNEKQTIVDTLAEDEDHRKFFVEFQIWDHRYFIERGLYYWAHNYCDLLKEGEGYNRLYPVIGIF